LFKLGKKGQVPTASEKKARFIWKKSILLPSRGFLTSSNNTIYVTWQDLFLADEIVLTLNDRFSTLFFFFLFSFGFFGSLFFLSFQICPSTLPFLAIEICGLFFRDHI